MGGSSSSRILPFEEAQRRCSEAELARIRKGFERMTPKGAQGTMDKMSFLREVTAEQVPRPLAERMFEGFDVDKKKTLSFKDFLSGLVIFLKGNRDERAAFVTSMYDLSKSGVIERVDVNNDLRHTDGTQVAERVVRDLFREAQDVEDEAFKTWLLAEANKNACSITRWINNQEDTQAASEAALAAYDEKNATVAVSLAKITLFDENEIKEIESRFYFLKANPLHQIDNSVFRRLFTPHITTALADRLFLAFDENDDGVIDFREFACGLSKYCRGDPTDRLKNFFRMFDVDNDGNLSRTELASMLRATWRLEDMLMASEQEVASANADVNATNAELQKFLKAAIEAAKKEEAEGRAAPPPTAAASAQEEMAQMNPEPVFLRREDRTVSSFERHYSDAGTRKTKRSGSETQVAQTDPMQMIVDMAFAEAENHNYMSFEMYSKWTEKHPTSTLFLETINKISSMELGLKPTTRQKERDYIRARMEAVEQTPMKPGDIYYIVSQRWWAAWKAFVRYDTGEGPDAPTPGPMNNNELLIIDPKDKSMGISRGSNKLRPNLREGTDYAKLPLTVFELLFHWYGGGPKLPRSVVMVRQDAMSVELYPLTIAVVQKPPTKQERKSKVLIPRRYVQFSKQATMGGLLKFLCEELPKSPYGPKDENKPAQTIDHTRARLWVCGTDKNKLVARLDETLEDAHVAEGTDIFMEMQKETGEWEMEAAMAKEAPPAAAEEVVEVTPGLTGLNNLGNTCFLNSAVQCLSNTRLLTEYCRSGAMAKEINLTNPIGYKGQIARRYAELIQKLWAGNAFSVAPLKFRWTVGKFQPAFSTSQQQDSQEFLAYLLDGLHEDCNRILQKPSVENPDSDGRPDKVVADESWHNYGLRNQSVVMDVFTGQLKSTLVCCTCSFTRVKFEEFRSLSLPMPVDDTRHFDVIIIWRDPSKKPTRFDLKFEGDKKRNVADIKLALQELTGINPHALVFASLMGGFVGQFIGDEQPADSLRGFCFGFEVMPLPPAPAATPITGSTATTGTFASAGSSFVHVAAPGSASPSQPAATPSATPATTSGANTPVMPAAEAPAATAAASSSTPSDNTSATPVTAAAATPAASAAPTASPGTARAAEPGAGVGTPSTPQRPVMNYATPATQITAVSPGEPGTIHIFAVNRKLLKQEVFFIIPYRMRLFGRPLVLSFSSYSMTKAGLYAMAWHQMKKFLGLDELPSERAHKKRQAETQEDIGMAPIEYPFKLRMVSRDGSVCSRCTWDKFCFGCEIPPVQEPLQLFHMESVAIDWDLSLISMYYNYVVEKEMEDHESIQASQKTMNLPVSLDECLGWFTKEEKLDKDETWYCPGCKDFREATKKMEMWRMPPVLIIHLKRFQLVGGRTWIKSNKEILAPLKGFDASRYTANKEQADPMYDLYAVTNHYGSLGGGHYTATALHEPTGKWYMYNDSSCDVYDREDIVGPAAYVLFYKRREQPTLESLLPAEVRDGSKADVEVPSDDEDRGGRDKCTIL